MYDLATYFAWFVIALLFTVVVVAIVALGSLPARIAAARNNPQVDAINAASWIGLACGGIGWPIAFVWAFWRTPTGESGEPMAPSTGRLEQELGELRAQLAELRSQYEAARSPSKPNG